MVSLAVAATFRELELQNIDAAKCLCVAAIIHLQLPCALCSDNLTFAVVRTGMKFPVTKTDFER